MVSANFFRVVGCAAALLLAACQLPSNVLYECGPAGECGADTQCWPDGYCHPLSDGTPPDTRDSGTSDAGRMDAGAPDGGTSDAGASDAGDDAGFDAGDDAGFDGGDDAGVDGGFDAGPCVPVSACPLSAQCGTFDAGCGFTLECGECFAPEECGTVTANQCGLPKLCQQGFCWENPLPQGNTLYGAFAFGPKAVWAVGEAGTVLFWNGERTFLVDVGTTSDLYAVWGTGPNDFFIGGDDGFIVHFNGSSWQREVTPGAFRINALWVAPTGVAFAAGNGGAILKRTGNTWTGMTLNPSNTSDVLALTGLDTGEVFAVTTTRAYRLPALNATTWVGEPAWTGNPNTRETMALASSGPQMFVGWKVAGQNFGNVFERQSDAGWRQFGPNIPGGVAALALTAAGPWVSTTGGVVTRLQPDGGLVQAPLSRDAGLYALTPTTIDDVFTAGGLGTMAVVSSDAGERELFFGGTTEVRGVCGFAETATYPSQAYAPGEQRIVFGRVAIGDRARWDPVVRMASSQDWNACFADQPNRVFIVGNQREYLRQNAGVFVIDDFVNDNDWFGAWGSPGGPYWFINDGANIYTSATGASAMYTAQAPGNPRGIWGLSPSDILVVGLQLGAVRRYNGSSWVDVFNVPQTFRQLRAVHGANFADGGSLYSIVGTGTVWRRFPDGGFVADFIDAGHVLRGTYVMPEGDVWAAGDDGGTASNAPQGRGVLWHFEPATQVWSPMNAPAARPFNAMGGFNDTPFIVGGGGAILRKIGLDGG